MLGIFVIAIGITLQETLYPSSDLMDSVRIGGIATFYVVFYTGILFWEGSDHARRFNREIAIAFKSIVRAPRKAVSHFKRR